MKKNKTYNVCDYISNTREEYTMNINSIFPNKEPCYKYQLLKDTHKSIKTIEKKPFYVDSQFSDISIKKNPKFLIFSAPGATGKSTFAKHIAYTYNAIYWDLSQIILGDNSFHGTIHRALGVSNISNFAKDLASGRTMLIIDAIDEAEMHSGRENVEKFLEDVNDFVGDTSVASVILLSRTETSQFVAAFFESKNIPFCHYEIGLFTEGKALEFVRRHITEINEKGCSPVIEECISEYFKAIRESVNDISLLDNFLRYAPVLEAIATDIAGGNNTVILLEKIKHGDTETNLMNSILERLLFREQDKVCNALKSKCKDKYPEFTNWESIYGIKEQMIRLCMYILCETIDIGDYNVDIPAGMRDDYSAILKAFVVQHPFISNNLNQQHQSTLDFTSPAFRDCVMATLLLDDDYEYYVDMYYRDSGRDISYPTQLFFRHYIKTSNGVIKGVHFPYMYEAFKSMAGAKDVAYISISEDNQKTLASFCLESYKKNTGKDLEQHLEVVGEDALCFDSIINVDIDIEEDVNLGFFHDDIRVVNSSISCNKLAVDARSLTIESYDPYAVSIIAKSEIFKKRLDTKIEVRGNNNVKISSPNLNVWPKLYDFKYDFEDANKMDLTLFIHHLQKIFVKFRTDNKDMPAKMTDYVDNVLLRSSRVKQKIFNFLLNTGIMFKDEHLYKINIDNMSYYKISWGGLMTSNEEQLKTVYEAYTEWQGKQCKN